MNLKEIGFMDVDWIHVAKDWEELLGAVNMVMNYQVHKSCGTSWVDS
jgi:hypothetical protein